MSFLADVVRWFLAPAHWEGAAGISARVLEHVQMSLAATAVAALIALPLGLTLGRFGRGGPLPINVSNLGRALPPFPSLGLALPRVCTGAPPAFPPRAAVATAP